mmetsp:Transcript_27294/g.31156  ORF Transcript_27294/g.31156 Transcript_27294/m.31156 type:complete len:346 (+) Transcript_27294:246-1283(+)
MKLIPANISVSFVTIMISILFIIVAPTDVNAFAVHAQKSGISLSHVRDTTIDAMHFTEKHIVNRYHKNMLPTTTSLSMTALPSIGQFAAASFFSGCLGLWRTGYAVSYGYGGAMLASGLLQLSALRIGAPSQTTLQLHAAIYILYGIRLCGFLLNREIRLPVEIHQMKRRDASFLERLKRLPIVTGCSALFFCMAAAPMRALALVQPECNALTISTLAIGFTGFLLAAVGDWYKSKIKARDGPQKLVTSGPFRYFRHPNYTGEIIGWTCLCLLLPLMSAGGNIRRVIPWLIPSIIGWAGMVFAVLMGEATVDLEKKQKEKYGGTPEYKEWIKSSWSGPMFGSINK